MPTFDAKDIVQIDATVIVGALIFVSFQGIINEFAPQGETYYLSRIAFLIILPFAISAIVAIAGFVRVARGIMGVSFGALVIMSYITFWYPIHPFIGP